MAKIIITTTQNPYITGTDRGCYTACAEDADGNEYSIYWDILDDWNQEDDESDACDWDHPVSVINHSSNNDEVIDRVEIIHAY